MWYTILISFIFFCLKKRIFKAFTHHVTVYCKNESYRFLSNVYKCALEFYAPFKEKTTETGGEKEKHVFAFIHYLLIPSKNNLWNPTMCQGLGNQKPAKTLFVLFPQTWANSGELIPWVPGVWCGKSTGSPFKGALKKYMPEQKYIHIYEKENWSIFMRKMNISIF